MFDATFIFSFRNIQRLQLLKLQTDVSKNYLHFDIIAVIEIHSNLYKFPLQ